MVTEAIILAGGKGTRIRSITNNQIPKGLVEIQDRPIIEWEISWLAKYGIKRVILAIGHLAEKIEERFGNTVQTPFGDVELVYNIEKEKLGSGGGIKDAAQHLKTDKFVILNGDVMTNANLGDLISFHEKKGKDGSMFLVNMKSPYGIVEVKDDMITKFIEKPILPIPIHSGVDIINRSVVERFPEKGQMEDTIFVELADNSEFAALNMGDEVFWLSIDTPKDFTFANENWPGL